MPRKVPTYRPHRPKSYDPYEHSASRQDDKDFYCSRQWRWLRRNFLDRHPLCAECRRRGQLTPAEHVHHLIDRKQAPELAVEWTNLEALCESCHSSITGKRKGAQ